VRPALRAILAAREPLSVASLQRLFHWADEETRDFTRTLGSLFPTTKATDSEAIKPCHKSLVDWLLDEQRAGAYFVSARERHRLLAMHGWQTYGRGVGQMAPMPCGNCSGRPNERWFCWTSSQKRST